MKLYIKQRIFTWGQKFDVFDENGNVLFYCKGEILTIGRKLHIYDSNGMEIVFIKQKVISWMPRYEIYLNDKYAATLIKKFTFFSHDFRFENLNWKVEGDFFAHEYCISSNSGETIVNIRKKWFTWGDTYCMDINEKFNPLVCLASCIIIDCACHENNH